MQKNILKIKGNHFELNGEPFRFISGAIHYFRIPKKSWYHSLYNLKALGANTVETYVPWNMHEKKEGAFNFSDDLDLEYFIKLAEALGLWVILRPSPYICAEWEFGGFPAWLLKDKTIRIRSSEKQFLKKVRNYYEKLFEVITPLQSTQAGPILMMQLENEYGSYGNDKKYLTALLEMMKELGCEVPVFTSDGEWKATQKAGNLIEKGVLPTGNFGSKAKEKFLEMQKAYHQDFPLMCMEFWDGWFNRYGEKIIRRDAKELAESFKEALEIGSVNLYMFHGGTNYGFMNGCSSRGKIDLPQVTSYDYDAILDEAGNPKEKYYELQKVIHELAPTIEQSEPLVKSFMSAHAKLVEKVSYFEVKDQISKIITNDYPLTMEELDSPYGYVLYEHEIYKDKDIETFKVVDASDRLHFFINHHLIATQYQEIGEEIKVALYNEKNILSVLIENMGRVNYGARLLADSQHKGIRTGVMSDLHFISGQWRHYCLQDEKLSQADFSKPWKEMTPALYRFELNLEDEIEDTYIDVSEFGKGFVVVNGKNIGRFWDRGPFLTLYLSKSYLKKGGNEIIIFETEGRYSQNLHFVKNPIYLDDSQLIDAIKK